MIDEAKVCDIVNNPANSIDEIKEQLSKLDGEFEDIMEFVTLKIGDLRFKKKTSKHRPSEKESSVKHFGKSL